VNKFKLKIVETYPFISTVQRHDIRFKGFKQITWWTFVERISPVVTFILRNNSQTFLKQQPLSSMSKTTFPFKIFSKYKSHRKMTKKSCNFNQRCHI